MQRLGKLAKGTPSPHHNAKILTPRVWSPTPSLFFQIFLPILHPAGRKKKKSLDYNISVLFLLCCGALSGCSECLIDAFGATLLHFNFVEFYELHVSHQLIRDFLHCLEIFLIPIFAICTPFLPFYFFYISIPVFLLSLMAA